MLRNYLLVAIRHILKDKAFSAINILGLSLGMAFTIVILLWIQDELSYDKFHAHHNRIYHVYLRVLDVHTSFNFQPTTSHEMAAAMLRDIPEIERVCRMNSLGELAFRAGDNTFIESDGFAVDTGFFSMFTYRVMEGDPAGALEDPSSIVLTEGMARKYFGDADPIGQTVRINNRVELTVRGVIGDVPPNTHRTFDFLVPFGLNPVFGFDISETGNLYSNCRMDTYVMLDENADPAAVKAKVTETFRFEGDIRGETFLVALPRTNRYSQVGGDMLIYLFFVVAILILLIACINFMNLSTAKATVRIKEVGIRKVFGASRGDLFRQFMGETFLYALVSLNFALIVASLFMPVLNRMSGKEIHLNYMQPTWIAILLVIWIFTSFTAGSYPSVLLAGRLPVRIFQQQGYAGSGRSPLRVILVTSQFVFATLFLITALVVNRQFHYMDRADLGYEKKDLLYLRLRDQTRDRSGVIKTSLLSLPGVSAATNTSHLPVLIAGGYYQVWGRSDEEARYLASVAVDYDYVTTMGTEMALGRFYSRDYSGDSVNAVVINETAAKAMEWEDPVGESFFYRGDHYDIIGVMKDFHHLPLLLKITPLVFRLHPAGNDYLLVRLEPSGPEARARTLEQIRVAWKDVSPDFPIEYNFVEDYRFPQEQTIETAEKLMWYFTLLAILISGLGLYGLSTFMAERRTHEIGIRKAMGASPSRIIRILSREYLRILLFATLVAWPLGWFLMKKLLSAFAYRIGLSIWIFIGVGVFICLLAMVAVGLQARRSAVQNPANILRYE